MIADSVEITVVFCLMYLVSCCAVCWQHSQQKPTKCGHVLVGGTHLMSPSSSSFVYFYYPFCMRFSQLLTTLGLLTWWCIDAQLLNVGVAVAANDLCISDVLWFHSLPLCVVKSVGTNNKVLLQQLHPCRVSVFLHTVELYCIVICSLCIHTVFTLCIVLPPVLFIGVSNFCDLRWTSSPCGL